MSGHNNDIARLLVSDVDGTLILDNEPSPGLETLRWIVDAHPEEVRLVYATGRSFKSTMSLIEQGILPEPDAIAPFIGTEMWFPPWESSDPEYESFVKKGWDRNSVIKTASSFPELELQPEEFQSPLKASFYLDDNDKTIVEKLEKALAPEGLETLIIYSIGRFLDIIPGRAGKRNAAEYLRQHWNVDKSMVLTCGDSGNDYDMLKDPRFLSVAVGNSEKKLRKLSSCGKFHHSELPAAAGVLEGAEVFNFWEQNTQS